MVANVSSSTAVQNRSPVPQNSSATGASSGPSFATMLNNEIHTSTPKAAPTPKPSAGVPKSTTKTSADSSQGSNHSKGDAVSGNAKSTATNAASTSTAGNKKSDKSGSSQTSGQTDTAAANAAALAGAGGTPTADAAAAAASTAAVSAAATTATESSNAITSDAAATAAAATAATESADEASAATTTAATTTAAAASAAAASAAAASAAALPSVTARTPAAAIADMTGDTNTHGAAPVNGPTVSNKAPTVTPAMAASAAAQMNVTAGKNSIQQSTEFNMNKSVKSEAPDAGKTGTEAAPLPATPVITTTAVQPASPATSSASTGNAQSGATTLADIKSANQDLSGTQFSAIAPVLSAPATLDTAAAPVIAPQVGSPNWDQAVGQKINWMVSGGQSSASLTLNPPELGPMQVTLSMNNQHVNATFVSHQPEVRAALENAIPKLREMMEQSGIQLGQCNVNSQASQQNFAQSQSGAGSGSGTGSKVSEINDSVNVMPSNTTSIPRSGTGLVDTFV